VSIEGIRKRQGALGIEEVTNLDSELAKATDRHARREQIAPEIISWIKESPNARMIYFGPSRQDATLMSFLLRQKGIRACHIDSDTDDGTRRQLIADFKSGQIQVICNCEILTAGFDCPQVTHLVIARHTVSAVLYEQMLGRGIRGPRFGGTEKCIVGYCQDDFETDTLPELAWNLVLQHWGLENISSRESESSVVAASEHNSNVFQLPTRSRQHQMPDPNLCQAILDWNKGTKKMSNRWELFLLGCLSKYLTTISKRQDADSKLIFNCEKAIERATYLGFGRKTA
jgi:hypothetical protein